MSFGSAAGAYAHGVLCAQQKRKEYLDSLIEKMPDSETKIILKEVVHELLTREEENRELENLWNIEFVKI